MKEKLYYTPTSFKLCLSSLVKKKKNLLGCYLRMFYFKVLVSSVILKIINLKHSIVVSSFSKNSCEMNP